MQRLQSLHNNLNGNQRDRPQESLGNQSMIIDVNRNEKNRNSYNYNCKDAFTTMDDSMIYSMKDLASLLEEIESDLKLTKEMMIRNQEKQLKAAVLQCYDRLQTRIKKIDRNFNLALTEERICKKREIDGSLQELSCQHEVRLFSFISLIN